MKAGWFINLALGQQCAWAVPGDLSQFLNVTTPFTVGVLDRIESVDITFNDEYEWESDFPDGGAGCECLYAFDTGILREQRRLWQDGPSIGTVACFRVLKSVVAQTTTPGPRYPCRRDCGGPSAWRRQTCNHPRNAGDRFQSRSTIIGVLNAMDEVVSSVERHTLLSTLVCGWGCAISCELEPLRRLKIACLLALR